MSDVISFGEKETFSIEVGRTKKPAKFKLRFWVRNNAVGDFKKADDLRPSVNEFKRFIEKRDAFYLDLFDHLQAKRIYYFLLGMNYDPIDREKEPEGFARRLEFLLHFGNQFFSATSGIILLFKGEKVIFLVPKIGGAIDTEEIPFSYFNNVVNKYITFCDQEGLV
jgi:hypothetical protein